MIALPSLWLAATVALVYPWDHGGGPPLSERIAPPLGHRRIEQMPRSFGAWLRGLPTLPGRPKVHLFDGRPKGNQSAQHLVIDIDVGTRDLQQCADAVMRLRAEWLLARGEQDAVCFHFTSGDAAPWRRYRDGLRPIVRGSQVRWSKQAAPQSGQAAFRRYLDLVFTYAGTVSLNRELVSVGPQAILPGDVFIQAGSPGHAMLVVDVAVDGSGKKVFLLAQSYMSAQQIHVVRCPGCEHDPWYRADGAGAVTTPEWTFGWSDLKRFPPEPLCR